MATDANLKELTQAGDDWYHPVLGRVCRNCKEEQIAPHNRYGICQKRKECRSAYQRAQYTAKQKQGLCTKGGCNHPLAEGNSSHCPKHRDQSNKHNRQRRHESQDQGLCTESNCAEPLAEGNSWFCAEHRDEFNEYQRERRRRAKTTNA